MFLTMYQQRNAIKKLGNELQRHNESRGTGLNMAQLAKSKQARTSFISLTKEIQWLIPKFEEFLPAYWYHGVVLLVLRLLQTSFIALLPSQLVQAIAMCSVTQFSILLQSELAPYRRTTDNRVALLAQVLVFTWAFILMLRIVGVFVKPAAATAIGILLCVATVAVFAVALILANGDRLAEKRANTTLGEPTTSEDPNDETGEREQSGGVEAGPSVQGRESPANEEKVEQPDATAGEEGSVTASRLVATSPEDNFLLGMLCAVGQTQPDDTTEA